MAATSGLLVDEQGSLVSVEDGFVIMNPAVTLAVNVANAFNAERASGDASLPNAWLINLFAPFLGSVLSAAIFYSTRSQEYAPSTLGRHTWKKAGKETVTLSDAAQAQADKRA